MIVWGVVIFVVVLLLQMWVMCVVYEVLGFFFLVNIGVFNFGNVLGVVVGGVVIFGGLGYVFVLVMGVIIVGLVLLLVWFSG